MAVTKKSEPKLPGEVFVLCIVHPLNKDDGGPCCQPIGVFATEKQALQYAAENPPRPLGEIEDPVWDTMQGAGIEVPGSEDRIRPFGYRLIKFYSDRSCSYANVEPYRAYNPAEAPTIREIDPEQELNWI